MTRRILPNRRDTTTISVKWRGARFEVSLGRFSDGTPAEAFISGTKPGNDVQIVACDAAVLLSLALQHGVPLDTIAKGMAREGTGNPQSIVGAVVDTFAEEIAG